MSIQQQARALMSRHHQMIRNREQSMLLRTGSALGLDESVTRYHSHVQGQTPSGFGAAYDRSHAAAS